MRHGENEVRLQALHRAPPQQLTLSVVKPKGRPAASVKPGLESYVRSCGIIILSAQGPSDGSGRGPPQTRLQWSITLGSPMKRDNANRRIPVHISTLQGIWTQVPCDGKQTGRPLDQWDMVRMKWDCRLCTHFYFIHTLPSYRKCLQSCTLSASGNISENVRGNQPKCLWKLAKIRGKC